VGIFAENEQGQFSLTPLAEPLRKSGYGDYLLAIAQEV